ncbi:MAG: iron chelate uptake ABC transporter family permease subunit [Alkalibacterium sp.]|nr:iron chelate uptake ABC transporter family permease subunit [Alkalibacterium sp.]
MEQTGHQYSEWTSVIVWNFRIPRVLITFIIGAMLAVSGVLLQGVLRNPLADASVLGITSMSGAGAMILLVLFPGISIVWLPLGAVLGAVTAMLVIVVLRQRLAFSPS